MHVAFFSFKGGVGRSMTLASTAVCTTAEYEKRVGLVDGDIEAPSLHYLFNVQPDLDQNFVDVLLRGVTGTSLINERVMSMRDVLPDEKTIRMGNGELYLFPTLLDGTAERKIPQIPLDNTTQDTCENFLNNFALAKGLDHVFIDCRTGVSTLASMFLSLVELVVLVCRVDRQNLHGVRAMIPRIKRQRKDLIVVASMVPLTAQGSRKLNEFQESIGQRVDVVVPFDERLAFGDIIAPLEYNPEDETCRAFSKVAQLINGGN